MVCRRPVRLVWLALALATLLIPMGVWFWKPRIDALKSVMEHPCVVTNASISLALPCPPGGSGCGVQFSVNVTFDLPLPTDNNRSASFVMNQGPYNGPSDDPVLLGRWPIGLMWTCYQTQSSWLPECAWFCATKDAMVALENQNNLATMAICVVASVSVVMITLYLIIPSRWMDKRM